MLKLNENQVDALVDALYGGEVAANTRDDFEDDPYAIKCSKISERISNHQPDFTSDDVKTMLECLDVVIADGEDITPEHHQVHKMLSEFKDSKTLEVQYV